MPTPRVCRCSVFSWVTRLPGNFEELSAITVNPVNGDVYVLSFDSGNVGVPDPVGDTQGDLDITRIPFATIYDHWAANFEGKDVQALALVTGPGPTGSKNMNNADYVTYGTGSFDPFHSNQFVLASAVEKIGQINRGNGNNFFPFALEFIDQSTLVLLDDSIGQAGPRRSVRRPFRSYCEASLHVARSSDVGYCQSRRRRHELRQSAGTTVAAPRNRGSPKLSKQLVRMIRS